MHHLAKTPTLTIGMAVHDDFDGVYFTTQALRLYHSEAMPRVEIVVVDNSPSSKHGEAIRRHVEQYCHVGNAGMQYIAMEEATGTTQPREEVFRRARGEWVMCMDSHVLLDVGAVMKLLAYCDANPDSRDLLSGPMLYDDLRAASPYLSPAFEDESFASEWASMLQMTGREVMDALGIDHPVANAVPGVSTHFDDIWRNKMWGIWGTDPRGIDPDGEPFEIFAQGLGLFACRKAAWLGFHPDFRQFGGEECYIHTKFRQAGRKCLCLPFLRWNHRFPRPGGRTYPATTQAQVRNYALGHRELGIPLDRCREHFLDEGMSPREFDRIAADPRASKVRPEPRPPRESARDLFADLYARSASPVGDIVRKMGFGPDRVTVMTGSLGVAVAAASSRPRLLDVYHPAELDLTSIHRTQEASPVFAGRMIQSLATHVIDGEIPQISQSDLLIADASLASEARKQIHRVRGRVAMLGDADTSWLLGEWGNIYQAEGLAIFSRIPGDSL